MPELPEVETIRRDLEGRLIGRRIEGLWTSGKALRLARPVATRALAKASTGSRIVALRRRAKYLLVDLDGGDAILVHLGMSGRLRVVDGAQAREAHTHVIWRLDDGAELRFIDTRRFGQVLLVARGAEATVPELAILGVDPLGDGLTEDALAEMLAKARRDVKTFLLDQRHIAGLGNIYVSEALFEAGIHPHTRTDRVGRRRVPALRAAIVQVLERGLANRGTTLRDYVDGSGEIGGNQHQLRVYGREGESCPRGDGGRVRRVVTQARATFFCPICQTRR